MAFIERINAILDCRNFDCAFDFLWGDKGTKKTGISKDSLARNVFEENANKKSENECQLLFDQGFRVSKLKEELSQVSSSLFSVKGKKVFIRADQYITWKKLMTKNGQDLFVASAFLDSIGIDWPFFIPVDLNALGVALSQGYSENHCHLSAAGPVFSINWVCLHNDTPFIASLNRLKKKRHHFLEYYSEEIFWEFYNVSLLAIYLRRHLYCVCSEGKTSENDLLLEPFRFSDLSKSKPSFEKKVRDAISKMGAIGSSSISPGPIVDYANGRGTDNPLYGERKLLCSCLDHFDSWNQLTQWKFYLYLLCKRFIFCFFTQNNHWYGFRNFKRFERAGDLFIPDNPLIKRKATEITYESLCKGENMRSLEVRTAPAKRLTDLRRRVEQAALTKKVRSDVLGETKVGLVLHFIKKARALGCSRCSRDRIEPRSFESLAGYQLETRAIKLLYLNQKTDCDLPLVGIDAANDEIRCRPELFAPFYRELRHFRGKNYRGQTLYSNLKFTFHCGEDFTTLADGLRAIYEAITYLDLNDGDRIGHASALGTDSEKYFILKGYKFTTTYQDYLDDCCFLYSLLPNEIGFYTTKSYLLNEIQNVLSIIYSSSNYVSYLRSFSLRGDNPRLYSDWPKPQDCLQKRSYLFRSGRANDVDSLEKGNYALAWQDEHALEFIYRYHFSKSVRERGDHTHLFNATPEYILAIKECQRQLVLMIKSRNIGIETNPTSNYLIGPYDEFEDIPVFSLMGLNREKAFYKGLRLSIGTDDPGLFNASLRNEYGSIIYSLKDYGMTDGEDQIEVVKKLALSSIDLSFVK